jgi:hypothetical protein
MVYDDDDDLGDEMATVERIWTESASGEYMHLAAALGGSKERMASTLDVIDLLPRYPLINGCIGALDGMAGVVVGAGPSLDRNIDMLREHRGKFVVAAVNSSLPALDAAGIVPDLVIVAEAKNVLPSIQDSPSIREAIMVPGIHVHPSTWALPWRAIAPAISDEGGYGTWLRHVVDCVPVPIGGSAATIAGGVLYLLGCDPIVLVGNDCAVDASTGRMYASGAAYASTTAEVVTDSDGDEVGVRIVRDDAKLACDTSLLGRTECRDVLWPLVRVKGWHGTEIASVLVYDGLRQWWEEIGEAWSLHRELINATEGGAHIEHWECRTLADVCADLEVLTFDPREILLDKLGELAAPSRQKIRDAMTEQKIGAERIGELAREGVSLLRRAREIQIAITELHHDGDLLDAYSWGDVETIKKTHGDKPILEVLGETFAALEKNAAELASRLAEIEGSLDG